MNYNKNIRILILALCSSSVAFSCEKAGASKADLPEHVKASMARYAQPPKHEWTCRPCTPEEIAAIDKRHFDERVAVVRDLIAKNNVPQDTMTDVQADALYRDAIQKVLVNQCNQQ